MTIGIGLGLLLNPGRGTLLDVGAAQAPTTQGTWGDFLQSLIPSNVLGASASSSGALSFNVLQIVVLAIVVGVAVLKVGDKAEPFLAFSRSALEIVQKVLWWIIRLAPIGTVGLLGNAVASYGWGLLAPLATFTVAVYVGCAIVLFVVYPALAAIVVAQVFGVQLNVTDQLLIAFVSVVGSAATASLTGAVVMLTLTLSTLGLPLAAA